MQHHTEHVDKNKKKNFSISSVLKDSEAFSGFSVSDIETTKKFYGKTLGLDITEEEMETLCLHVGENDIFIYPKDNHRPATFTILNFPVDNIDEAVDSLTKSGIKFEHYDGQLKTDDKGIYRDGPVMAWFKDPSGNILSLIEE